MEDIQNHRDDRNIDIDQVGVKGIRYPITVLDKNLGEQQTIAKINMYVNLPRHYKGTHMSRFVEILNEHSRRISLQSFPEIMEEMKKRLNAESAHMEITFPYFIKKEAPVTRSEGLMEYKCTIRGALNAGMSRVEVERSLEEALTLAPDEATRTSAREVWRAVLGRRDRDAR